MSDSDNGSSPKRCRVFRLTSLVTLFSCVQHKPTNTTLRQENPTVVRFEGEVSFQTASKKLAWLNTTKGWVEGTNDMSTGEATGKVYAKK